MEVTILESREFEPMSVQVMTLSKTQRCRVRACVLIMMMCGGGVMACTTAHPTSDPEVQEIAPKPKPQDLFETLRQPYKDAVRSSRVGDKRATRHSIRAMLEALERVRLTKASAWPAPYNSEPELMESALKLLINQTKVSGVLSLTGEYEEAYTTLMDLGGVLKGVRRHLGITRPTDLLIGVYQALEGIESEMASGQEQWVKQLAYITQIQEYIDRLQAMPDAMPVSCRAPNTWAFVGVLREAAELKQRQLLYESWLKASREFHVTLQLCG